LVFDSVYHVVIPLLAGRSLCLAVTPNG
jgi:hypothetical protein